MVCYLPTFTIKNQPFMYIGRYLSTIHGPWGCFQVQKFSLFSKFLSGIDFWKLWENAMDFITSTLSMDGLRK